MFLQQAEESAKAQRRVRGPFHLGRDPDPERAISGLRLKTAETLTKSAGTCEYVDDSNLIALVHCGNGQDLDTAKMADVMSVEQRSAAMSKIRSRDTKPELWVRQALWHSGFRYRLHAKELPGRPDIVLPRWRTVVFVHGCFWHRHEGCPFFRLPSTRPAFWDAKLGRNQVRDTAAVHALCASGWRVAVVWECALKGDLAGTAIQLVSWIKSRSSGIELFLAGARVARKALD
jgi:DNA mismatch endonuclease (patch repair protein)